MLTAAAVLIVCVLALAWTVRHFEPTLWRGLTTRKRDGSPIPVRRESADLWAAHLDQGLTDWRKHGH